MFSIGALFVVSPSIVVLSLDRCSYSRLPIAPPALGRTIRLGVFSLCMDRMHCIFKSGRRLSGTKLAKPETRGNPKIVVLSGPIVSPSRSCGVSELLLLTLICRHGMMFSIGSRAPLLSTVSLGCKTLMLLWNPPTTSLYTCVCLLGLSSVIALHSRVKMLLWLTLFVSRIGVLMSPVSFTPITLLVPRPTLVGSFVFLTMTTLNLLVRSLQVCRTLGTSDPPWWKHLPVGTLLWILLPMTIRSFILSSGPSRTGPTCILGLMFVVRVRMIRVWFTLRLLWAIKSPSVTPRSPNGVAPQLLRVKTW